MTRSPGVAACISVGTIFGQRRRSIVVLAFALVLSPGMTGTIRTVRADDQATGRATQPAAKAKHHTFAEVVDANFARWDRNHNGRLEAEEIDKALHRSGLHGEAAAALATIKMRERRALAAEVKDYAATQRDLEQGIDHAADQELDRAHGTTTPFKFETVYEKNLKALTSIDRELFVGGKPDFSKLRQGAIGDCFFFSVVGNLAAHQPRRLVKMITRQENGHYVVHFGDGVDVDLAPPSDAEILINNSTYSIESGTWITVLELAVGRRLQEKLAADHKSKEDSDAISFGGSSGAIIRMFTGHQTESIALRAAKPEHDRLAQLRQVFPEALAAHRLVAVSMGKSPPDGGNKIPGLGYGHVYAVFGYDQATDHVTLWNPWGNDFKPKGSAGVEHGYDTKHGQFQVPLKTLYHQFSNVCYETTKKLDPAKSRSEKTTGG